MIQRLLPAGTYYGWVIVGSALVINLMTATLNPVIFSFFIGPVSEELNVGISALSWALTIRLVTAGLAGPVLGRLIDRYGTRWLGAACGLLAGGMMVALSLAHELWLIYVLFGITGLAGFGGPAGQLLTQVPISKWFVLKRGRALALATTGLAAGTTVAIPMAQWLIEAIGWRQTYVVFGLAIILTVVPICVLLVRRTPEDMGLYPDGADPPLLDAGGTNRITTEEEWTVREALATPAMWLLLGAFGLAGIVLTGTLVHRVHFWEELGMSPGLVGLGTALDPLTVVFSIFAFGMLADRVPVRYLGVAGLAGLSLSIVPLIISTGEPYTILLHNFTWGAAAGGYITLNSVVWPNYFGREAVGAIRGVVLPVSISASGIGAPLYGYLLDSGVRPDSVWAVSLCGFALAGAFVLFARPPRRAVKGLTHTEPALTLAD